MVWSKEQLQVLEKASKSINPAYLRIRSLAVWHAANGKSCIEIADCLQVTRQSVGKWVKDFQADGLAGLCINPGRGRKPKAIHSEVMDYVLQSPLNFGIKQNRWTLQLLADTVPSLRGFSTAGVLKVLRRLGISYKRGQPRVHSPDPQYTEKKADKRNL